MPPTVNPSDTPWGRYWRTILEGTEPVWCADSGCTAHRSMLDALAPEWHPLMDAVHDLETCNKVLVGGGEGSAKSATTACFLFARTRYDHLVLGKSDLVWIIGADYEDAHREWSLVRSLEEAVDNVAEIKDSVKDTCILETKDGIRYVTISGNNPKKVARLTPDIIAACEPSMWNEELFERSFNRLRRQPHTTFFGGGSFESSIGAFADIWNSGQSPNPNRLISASIPAWANWHQYPGGADDPRVQEARYNMSADRFAERMEGRPAPPKAAVIKSFRVRDHVNPNLVYDPRAPVYLFVDPGTLCCAVLFVQIVGGEVHVMDELYLHNYSQIQVINEARNGRHEGWRHIRAEGHVMDFAGRQHHGGPSAWETWKKETGLAFYTSEGPVKVDDKAERVLSILNVNPLTGRPFLQVHPRCAGLIAEAGAGPSPLRDVGLSFWARAVHVDGSIGQILSKNDHAWSALAYGLIRHLGVAQPGMAGFDGRPQSYSIGPVRRELTAESMAHYGHLLPGYRPKPAARVY